MIRPTRIRVCSKEHCHSLLDHIGPATSVTNNGHFTNMHENKNVTLAT